MNELEQKRYILSGLVQTCFLAALFYPIWYYLDLVEIFGPSLDLRNVSPVNVEVAKQCAVIRLVVVLVLIVFIYFARHPLSPSVQSIKRLIYLGALAQQLFGQGIILLIWVLNKVTPDAFTGNYFAGLIMVFIVIAILTPWSPWLTMGQIAILSLSYVSAAFMSGVKTCTTISGRGRGISKADSEPGLMSSTPWASTPVTTRLSICCSNSK